jgi:hypothetical protein
LIAAGTWATIDASAPVEAVELEAVLELELLLELLLLLLPHPAKTTSASNSAATAATSFLIKNPPGVVVELTLWRADEARSIGLSAIPMRPGER